MANPKVNRLPTRLSALFFTEIFCNFVNKARTNLDIDNDEIIISCFIASRNMKSVLNNRDEAKIYGYEENALPESERIGVSVKDIVSNLHIPRETVRRKLVSLTEKKIIIKASSGYILPPQLGEADLTSELRDLVVGSFNEFLDRVDKVNKIR